MLGNKQRVLGKPAPQIVGRLGRRPQRQSARRLVEGRDIGSRLKRRAGDPVAIERERNDVVCGGKRSLGRVPVAALDLEDDIGAELLVQERRDNGEAIWTFATRGQVNSSPVIAGNRVYFGSADRNIYAVELANGKPVWKFRGKSDFNAAPSVAGGRLLIGSEGTQARLLCFGAK